MLYFMTINHMATHQYGCLSYYGSFIRLLFSSNEAMLISREKDVHVCTCICTYVYPHPPYTHTYTHMAPIKESSVAIFSH